MNNQLSDPLIICINLWDIILRRNKSIFFLFHMKQPEPVTWYTFVLNSIRMNSPIYVFFFGV